MALKDWKKYGEMEWGKIGDNYSYVKVWKIVLSSNERKKRGIGNWGYESRLGRTGITTKFYFKNKNQALKRAMSYMKKN